MTPADRIHSDADELPQRPPVTGRAFAGMLILDRLGVRLRPAADVLAPAWEAFARATGRPVPPLEDKACEVPCLEGKVQCRACAAAYGAVEGEEPRDAIDERYLEAADRADAWLDERDPDDVCEALAEARENNHG